MINFLESVSFFIKQYRNELILIILSCVTGTISLLMFAGTNQDKPLETKIEHILEKEKLPEKIFVHIGGAVEKPDMYELTISSRLKEALIKAGGLSSTADSTFFNRNFNLAKILQDQDKFYIPSLSETESGLFSDEIITPFPSENLENETSVSPVDINTASIEELDTLPRIGNRTAEKIIQNRPYSSVEDLVNKKVVNKATFEQVKDLLTTTLN